MRGLIVLLVFLLLAAGCSRDDSSDEESAEGKSAEPAASGSFGSVVLGANVTASPAETGAPAPGITVLATGEASAKPDRASMRLSIGSNGDFGPRSSFTIVKAKELEPVVDALVDEGVDRDNIHVNRFGASPYAGLGGATAQIEIELDDPQDAEPLIETAATAVRRHTDRELGNVEVVFTVEDCAEVERRAWKTALEDARQRAEGIAKLAGVRLGELVAISEAGAAVQPYGPSGTGCRALDLSSSPFELRSAGTTPEEVEVYVTLQATFAIART